MPEARRVPPKWSRAAACRSARARMKDECWDADEEAAMFARHRGGGGALSSDGSGGALPRHRDVMGPPAQ